MGDTLITVIAIALAAILMFVFPLMTMYDRTDDVSQLAVKTATTEFVDDVRTTGRLTMDKYSKLLDNCIESIIDVKAANDLDSLFNMGSDVLFSGNIKGLDDFELITFIVVK